MPQTPIIERAFEIARDPEVATLTEVRRLLALEGYEEVSSHLDGSIIRDQLLRTIQDKTGHRPRH